MVLWFFLTFVCTECLFVLYLVESLHTPMAYAIIYQGTGTLVVLGALVLSYQHKYALGHPSMFYGTCIVAGITIVDILFRGRGDPQLAFLITSKARFSLESLWRARLIVSVSLSVCCLSFYLPQQSKCGCCSHTLWLAQILLSPC